MQQKSLHDGLVKRYTASGRSRAPPSARDSRAWSPRAVPLSPWWRRRQRSAQGIQRIGSRAEIVCDRLPSGGRMDVEDGTSSLNADGIIRSSQLANSW